MASVKAVTLLSMLVWVALAAGCCKKEKEQIFQLESRYADLDARHKDLQVRLVAADRQADEISLQNKLDLDQKDAEIARLETELAAKPGPKKAPAEGWQATPLGDMITVGSDILFASGRAMLTKSGMARLERVAADIRREYPGLRVRVYGHTDSDPIKKTRRLWQDNLDLSANRAMAVARYLIRKGGVPARLIECVAMGEHHPVTANRGTGKAKNRRVEIVVVKKE